AMAAPDESADAQLVSATGTASGGGHAQGEGGGHGGGQSGGHGGGNSGGHGGGHGGHGGDGDAPDGCEFFLEHMWANEDGIPLLGRFSHLNEMHTDPAYEKLVLSLASGPIGHSDMPALDLSG